MISTRNYNETPAKKGKGAEKYKGNIPVAQGYLQIQNRIKTKR